MDNHSGSLLQNCWITSFLTGFRKPSSKLLDNQFLDRIQETSFKTACNQFLDRIQEASFNITERPVS
jgi:hypothetical protein